MTYNLKNTAGQLARKMNTPCLQGSTNILTARELMEKHDVDVIGVECRSDFVGIFSRNDYTNSIIRHNLIATDTILYEAMNADPPYINEDLSIAEACDSMLLYDLDYMPVVSGKSLCGILSLNDLKLVKGLIDDCKNAIFEKDVALNYIRGGESYGLSNYNKFKQKEM